MNLIELEEYISANYNFPDPKSVARSILGYLECNGLMVNVQNVNGAITKLTLKHKE